MEMSKNNTESKNVIDAKFTQKIGNEDIETKSENAVKRGAVFQQADNQKLWNVMLIAKDGSLHQNKLTIGLTFPCLAQSDMFSLQAEPVLIMAEYSLQELKQTIQSKIESLYSGEIFYIDVPPVKKIEDEVSWSDLEQMDESLEDNEQLSIKTTKKRGRPKGSKKKVKIEQIHEKFKSKDLLIKCTEGLPKPETKFIFSIQFDLESANAKFMKLYSEIKQGSKLLTEKNEKEKWKCCVCEETVPNLAIHVGKSHGHQDFICPKCDYICGSEYLLKHHESTHLTETGDCLTCGKTVENLGKHVNEEHKTNNINESLKCSQCDKVYTKVAELNRHFNSAHLGIKAKCPICQKELLPTKITSHIRMVHEKVKNHWCKECGKGFYDKRDMDLHVQRIHLHTKELCIECGKELSAGQLKNHIKKCHSGDAFKVICPICGKKVGYLDEHIKSVHKKEKNFKCPHCPLEVYKKNTLKRHLAWHEKKKLTVNGTLKKPRILKRGKEEMESLSQNDQDQTIASFHPAVSGVSSSNNSYTNSFSSTTAVAHSNSTVAGAAPFPFAFHDSSNIINRGLYFSK